MNSGNFLLYSKYSRSCKDVFDMIRRETHNGQLFDITKHVHFVCIDNKHVRERIHRSATIRMSAVPCVFVLRGNNVEKYEGLSAQTWIMQLIDLHTTGPEPPHETDDGKTPINLRVSGNSSGDSGVVPVRIGHVTNPENVAFQRELEQHESEINRAKYEQFLEKTASPFSDSATDSINEQHGPNTEDPFADERNSHMTVPFFHDEIDDHQPKNPFDREDEPSTMPGKQDTDTMKLALQMMSERGDELND